MTIRPLVALVAGALFLAACGADRPTAPTVAATIDVPSTAAVNTTRVDAATTNTTGTSPTTVTPTGALSTTTVATTEEAASGLPSTFLAITDDLVAVEVATASGEVVREIGHRSQPADLDAAGDEAATYNVVDAVVRTRDGSAIAVVECCEPAAGLIHLLAPDETIDPDVYGDTTTIFGWNVAPAPTGDLFAVAGYDLVVLPAADPANPRYQLFELDTALGSWATGAPAWDPSGQIVYWLGDGRDGYLLHSVDLAGEEPVEHSVPLGWVAPGEFLDGLAGQSSGNLVAFVTATNPTTGEPASTRGVVMSPAGELLTTFPVETGSTLGNYDPTGRFLIYVDGAGTVRWQGAGRSGELASGYVYASW